VMVREKQMPREQMIALTIEIIRRCRPFAARVILNGDVSVASDCGADGVHVPAAQLLQLDARPHTGWCSASCHNAQELAHAAALGLDFVLLGPVHSTPTHPDAQPLGWERFARMISGYTLPVFALGGLQLDDFDRACAAGAHGVAMIRGAWSARQSFPSDWSGSGSCAVGIR